MLTQLGIMEQVLGELPQPIAFLRAAWFMENAAWDVAPARGKGVIPSFLQPLDKKVPPRFPSKRRASVEAMWRW